MCCNFFIYVIKPRSFIQSFIHSVLRLNGVESSSSGFPQAVPPVVRVYPEIVEGAAVERDGAAVEGEARAGGFQPLGDAPRGVVLVKRGQPSLMELVQLPSRAKLMNILCVAS